MDMKKTAIAATLALATLFAGSAAMANTDDHEAILRNAGYDDVHFQGKGVGCSKSDLDTMRFTGTQNGVQKSGVVCTQYGSPIVKAFAR